MEWKRNLNPKRGIATSGSYILLYEAVCTAVGVLGLGIYARALRCFKSCTRIPSL